MSEYRRKVAPRAVAYADADNRKLIVEFATAANATRVCEAS